MKPSSSKKRPRSEIISKEIDDSTNIPGTTGEQPSAVSNPQVSDAKLMWEKLCITYQRLLLAKAVQEKLSDCQIRDPDATKGKLLKGLNEEVIMLSFVKSQLEEAMMKYFANEISLPKPSDNAPSSLAESTNTATNTFPLTHLVTPVTLPPHQENISLSLLIDEQTNNNQTLSMSNADPTSVIIPNSPQAES